MNHTPDKKVFKVDPTGRTWNLMKAYVEDRLGHILNELSSSENTRTQDLTLKGQIKELRKMLTLGKPLPQPKGQGTGNPRHE